MGLNIYVPDDVADPYLRSVLGDQKEAKELAINTLEENAPEVDHE